MVFDHGMGNILKRLSTPIVSLDDWGVNSSNNNLISKIGLSRVLNEIKFDQDFSILTAYKVNYTKEQKIAKNRDLRFELNKKKIKPYQLVGHWQKCQNSPYNYKNWGITERSYLAVKPAEMTTEEFQKFIIFMLYKFEQDCAMYCSANNINILEKFGNTFKIGSKISIEKISLGYSHHVRKINIPFIFEGIEVPSTNIGRMMFREAGLTYPIVEPEDLLEAITWSQINHSNN